MTPFIDQARSYAAYHKNSATRYLHIVYVSLLILSLMIILGCIQVVIPGVLDIRFSAIATLILLSYYFRLNWRLSLALIPLLALLLWISTFFNAEGPNAIALWSFITLVLFGTILMFTSYFIEGNRPPFDVILKQLAIAPLFLIADIFFMIGLMRPLKESIYGPTS